MAGALIRNMTNLKIDGRITGTGYPDDLSIQKLCDGVVAFKCPVWSSGGSSHPCSFKEIKNSFRFHSSAVELHEVEDTCRAKKGRT